MICVKPYWRKIPGSKVEVPLPCGQCVVCKINNARLWSFRMVAESGYWPESAFLTLTYSDDFVFELSKRDLQLAFKRARKSGLSFRYFACGEYGGQTKRPHYHVCLFYKGDLGFVQDLALGRNNGHLSWWPFGLCNLGSFSRESARYTADYLLKAIGDSNPIGLTPPFRLISTKVGKQYLLDNRLGFENQGFIRFGESFVSVPRYYRRFMVDWIDDDGVPLRNRRFISSLKGVSLLSYKSSHRVQRERNLIVRQGLYKKEF